MRKLIIAGLLMSTFQANVLASQCEKNAVTKITTEMTQVVSRIPASAKDELDRRVYICTIQERSSETSSGGIYGGMEISVKDVKKHTSSSYESGKKIQIQVLPSETKELFFLEFDGSHIALLIKKGKEESRVFSNSIAGLVYETSVSDNAAYKSLFFSCNIGTPE